MTIARRPSATSTSSLIILGPILENDLSNASITVVKNTLKWEIETNITYRVKIEKDRIYFIAERSEFNKV